MGNIFFQGAKDSKEDAIESVSKLVSDYCPCVFDAKVVSDDGGHILQVMVEVAHPRRGLIEQVPDFPLDQIIPKWHGWRAVIVKVPVGYIQVLVYGSD